MRPTIPAGMPTRKHPTKAATAGPASAVAWGDVTRNKALHDTQGYAIANPIPIIIAMDVRKKNALETYWRASSRLSCPCALAIPFKRPFVIPRSENPRIAITELIVIQSPYLSVPRYLKVSGTVMRAVAMPINLEMTDAAVVRKARR